MTFNSEPSRCQSILLTEWPDQLVWAPYPRRKKKKNHTLTFNSKPLPWSYNSQLKSWILSYSTYGQCGKLLRTSVKANICFFPLRIASILPQFHMFYQDFKKSAFLTCILQPNAGKRYLWSSPPETSHTCIQHMLYIPMEARCWKERKVLTGLNKHHSAVK